MSDLQPGYYWVNLDNPYEGQQWYPGRWDGSEWHGVIWPGVDSVTSVGPQIEPPSGGQGIRAPGFYWIQTLTDSSWQVASWGADIAFQNKWQLADNAVCSDDDIASIGPMVQPPSS